MREDCRVALERWKAHAEHALVEEHDLLGPGDTIAMTWGEETFTPIRFHTFTVGPFRAITTIKPNETALLARVRLAKFLSKMAALDFAEKVEGFPDRIKATRGAREIARVKSEG